MKKKFAKFQVIGFGLFAWIFAFSAACSEPKVEILADPRIENIEIGSQMIGEVALTTRTNRPDLTFEWKLDGPGTLNGKTDEPGLIYVPPDTMDAAGKQAIVTVTVTDENDKSASDNVSFNLQKSIPRIIVFDSKNNIIVPLYSVKRGEEFKIRTDADKTAQIEWKSDRGTIIKTDTEGIILYKPPDKPSEENDVVNLRINKTRSCIKISIGKGS